MLSAHPTLRSTDLRPFRSANSGRRLWSSRRIETTYNARSALYQLCRALPAVESQRPVFLLPAFHCATLVDVVMQAGYRPLFYRIHRDLTIDYADLIRKAQSDVAAVLVIHYFGFRSDLSPLLKQQREGAEWFLIEDWAHSFVNAASLELTGNDGDFALFSFYKLLPTHVGGGLRINRPGFAFQPTAHPVGVKDGLVILKRLLEEAIDNSADGYLKRALQNLERLRVARKRRAAAETGTGATELQYPFSEKLALTRLPWMSKWILETCDLRAAIAARRNNYSCWNAHLLERGGLAKLLRLLPDEVCPWAYPVLVPDRSKWDFRWREQNVPLFTFGDILHPTVGESDPPTFDDSAYLAKNLLLLGVHQGLTEKQIRCAAEIINYCFADQRAAEVPGWKTS